MNSFIDEDAIDLVNVKLTPSKHKRQRGAKQTEEVAAVNESYDLTDGSFEISPPIRSRRAADAITSSSDLGIIELDDQSPVEAKAKKASKSQDPPTTAKGRVLRGRSVKKPAAPKPPKAVKTKRLTYKQSLALINALIPEPPQIPVAVNPSPVKRTLQTPVQSSHTHVDLTGDVYLSEKHSSAPLFQKHDKAKGTAPAAEISDDDDDDKIRIKVKMMETIKAYPFRRHQRFYDLFKTLSEVNNIPMSNMFLFNGDKRIHLDDTPHSLNVKISTILTCRVMETKATDFKQSVKENQIELKFQSDKWKKPIAVKTSKVDDFKTALAILCEQVPFKPGQITLRFDGDIVNLSETPVDLDFEGGEILDCGIKI